MLPTCCRAGRNHKERWGRCPPGRCFLMKLLTYIFVVSSSVSSLNCKEEGVFVISVYPCVCVSSSSSPLRCMSVYEYVSAGVFVFLWRCLVRAASTGMWSGETEEKREKGRDKREQNNPALFCLQWPVSILPLAHVTSLHPSPQPLWCSSSPPSPENPEVLRSPAWFCFSRHFPPPFNPSLFSHHDTLQPAPFTADRAGCGCSNLEKAGKTMMKTMIGEKKESQVTGQTNKRLKISKKLTSNILFESCCTCENN